MTTSSGSDRRLPESPEREFLDAAISELRAAGADRTLSPGQDAERLQRLAGALRERFALLGEQSDIDAAIAAAMQAAALPVAREIRHAHARRAAELMRAKARVSRRRADAAALVTFIAERERDSDGTQAGDWANDLRAALLDRRELVGRRGPEGEADLDAAIRAARRSVAPSAGGAHRFMRLSALSWLLSFRFDATASLEDLSAAIDVAREAAREAGVAAIDVAREAAREAGGAAIDVAREVPREAAGAASERPADGGGVAPGEPSEQALALARLGRLLWTRYELLGGDAGRADLTEGSETAQQALALEPQGALAPDQLLLLASFCEARREDGAGVAREDAVLGYLERATELAPRSWPRLPEALARQAATLARRARLARQLGDLDRAIKRGDEALTAAAQRGLALGPFQVGLADLLRQRHGETGARRDRDRAIELYRKATAAETAPVALLRAAVDWASWAVSRHAFSEAVEAYQIAVAASERIDGPQLARELVGRSLAGAGALANAAAFALAREGLLDEAAQCIERGCGGDLSIAEIRRAARPASLVYLLATADGGLALIVDERDVPLALWLGELTADALAEQVKSWQAAAEAGVSFAAEIDHVTAWLWKVAMGAIVTELERTRAEQATLVPTGQLGSLPLHAAWTTGPRASSGRTYALDRVPILIAASARALSAARGLVANAGERRRLALDAGAGSPTVARVLNELPDAEIVYLGYPPEPVVRADGIVEAGAGGVVVKLWAVSDSATAMLMFRLCEAWRVQGESPARALCTAQQWLRDTTTAEKLAYVEQRLADRSHPLARAAESLRLALDLDPELERERESRVRAHEAPYHWAAFQLHGA